MSDDKMRAEFEAWVTENARYNLSQVNSPESGFHGQYKSVDTEIAFKLWQAAYASGQKAEREAIAHTSPLALQSKISFAALAALIEDKPEGER